MISSKFSSPYVVFINFSFGETTLSMVNMITTHSGYNNSETMYSSLDYFHTDIKYLLNIFRCSTAITYFHPLLKTIISEGDMIPNSNKCSLLHIKKCRQKKVFIYIETISSCVTYNIQLYFILRNWIYIPVYYIRFFIQRIK